MDEIREIDDKLQGILREKTKKNVMLAFSGGVDSSLLLQILCDKARENQSQVYAVTIHTRLHPTAELELTRQLAEEMGAIHQIIEVDELEAAGILNNPVERCYLCKKYLFTHLQKLAKKLKIETIMEGTNEDDLYVYRPGILAIQELGIESPLADLHITKAEIRALAARRGISVADRPSTPCLATRFPYHTPLSYEAMEKVEQGEAYLRNAGFYNVRLRVHGQIVRIEVDKADMDKLVNMKEQVITYLKNLGYDYVTLDLEGFRSGSMDIGWGM